MPIVAEVFVTCCLLVSVLLTEKVCWTHLTEVSCNKVRLIYSAIPLCICPIHVFVLYMCIRWALLKKVRCRVRPIYSAIT